MLRAQNSPELLAFHLLEKMVPGLVPSLPGGSPSSQCGRKTLEVAAVAEVTKNFFWTMNNFPFFFPFSRRREKGRGIDQRKRRLDQRRLFPALKNKALCPL